MNYSEFRNNLTESLNAVNIDGNIVIVSRLKGKLWLKLAVMNTIRLKIHFILPVLMAIINAW